MKDEKGAAVTAKCDQRLQIAVMIRSDVFRDCRARKIDSAPGPKEFFLVVNRAVAKHLAEVPVALPDLTEVLAEVARAGAGHLADLTATAPALSARLFERSRQRGVEQTR